MNIEEYDNFIDWLKSVKSRCTARTKDIWKAKQRGQDAELDALIKDTEPPSWLVEFGKNGVSNGLGSYCYHMFSEQPNNILEQHIEHHEKKFLETGLDLSTIYFPNKYGLIGKTINKDTIIPVIGYRLGYMFSVIKSHLDEDNSEKKVILEIGAGWGALPYIVQKNLNCCYLIVDIPSTLMLSAFFLLNEGKRVLLYNGKKEISQEVINSYDFILMSPPDIDNIPDGIFDFAVNTDSLSEMDPDSIKTYVELVARTVKTNGFFYENNPFIFNESTLTNLESKIIDPMSELIFSQHPPIHIYTPYICNAMGAKYPYREKLYQL